MKDVTSRPATALDVPFLTRVFLDSMKDVITAARGGWDQARETAQFEGQLAIDSAKVIQYCGRDVGFIMTVESAKEIQIHTLCILPAFQGRGIGSFITECVLADRAKTKRQVVLSVLKANQEAKRLYERLGFRVVAEIGHHYHMRHKG